MGTEANQVDVTGDLRIGSREALDQLVPLVYKELREIAHRHLSQRRDGATLDTTALVNEAYLKLVDQSRAQWEDRIHFLSVAALAMRHILTEELDQARRRQMSRDA